MREQTLFTFGYLSPKAEQIITELIASRVPLVDVRYSPTSRNWRYTQEAFHGRKGCVYYHIPDLGNERYKEALSGSFTEPHITLHNLEAGLLTLKTILDDHGGKAAIFCACNNKTMCHRIKVAEEVHKCFGVKIVHLPLDRVKR